MIARVFDFDIDDENTEKFASHGVTAEQVLQILEGPYLLLRNRRGRRASHLLLGRDYADGASPSQLSRLMRLASGVR
jgi:hypothetical protein